MHDRDDLRLHFPHQHFRRRQWEEEEEEDPFSAISILHVSSLQIRCREALSLIIRIRRTERRSLSLWWLVLWEEPESECSNQREEWHGVMSSECVTVRETEKFLAVPSQYITPWHIGGQKYQDDQRIVSWWDELEGTQKNPSLQKEDMIWEMLSGRIKGFLLMPSSLESWSEWL